MSRTLIIASALMAVVWTAPVVAGPVTVADDYYGGDDHSHGDVIGQSAHYDVDHAELSQSGSILTVNIFTNFAGRADDGLFAGYTDTAYGQGRGIGYSDLFLASAWTPDGSPSYLSDNNLTGTLWTFGVALDDRWSETGGAATLYALGGADNDANALMSDDFMSGAVYRNGQEVAVDVLSADVIALANDVSWSVEDGYLSFAIDLSGTGLSLTDGVAMHWGPFCGNDIIEGNAREVPEPGSLVLLSLALIGTGCSRRRKR